MAGFNSKINLSDAKVYQGDGQILTLSGDTKIATSGDLRYNVHPTFTGNTQIVDKKYVDDKVVSATGQTIYNLQTPATVTVGGITAGDQLTGKSSNCLLKEILTPYQLPSFSSFSNDVGTPVEVGCQITGSHSFSWGFSNANVQAGSMCIRDVTASSNLSTNISIASPAAATITNKTFASCGDTQVWCGSAKNTQTTQFGSGVYTTIAYHPYFWGKCTCPGVSGANRPVPDSTMVAGGNKVLAPSNGSFGITFNSGADDYLWFAVPSTVTDKSSWAVPVLSVGGPIGGGIGAGCNLFPAPVPSVLVTTACWSIPYDVYISNKQSENLISMGFKYS